jgi:hypothetical protein
VKEVALVLQRVEAFQKCEAAVALSHPRVVAGRDLLRAQAQGVIEEGLELDFRVAQHVGVGRSSRLVLAEELRKDAVLVVSREVDVLDLDAQHVGHAGRIEEVLARRAVFVVIVVLPVLHEDRDDLVALLLQQVCRDGGVDPAGQPDDDTLLPGDR